VSLSRRPIHIKTDQLSGSHKGNVNLATIIYLHRITDNRMAGSLLKNLRMFVSLCGQDAMPNVVIATTMWGEVKTENGERREKELKETFWKDLLDEGCRVERFEDTYESAWLIVDRLAMEDRAKMRLTHEMVDRRLTLQQTEAGIILNDELKRLIVARKEASRRLRAQAKKQDNALIVQELNVQQAKIDEQITQTADELQKLKIPFAAHIRKFVSSLTR
jgi:hypothetical protein